MGASGSGKSTLFNVLNGNEIPSEGTVLINGIDIHKDRSQIEGMIGYVPQDDLLIEDLTVYENLYFAAKLCFKDYDEKQLDELVSKTLTSLGLYEPRNLKVGSPLNKTISGGQRKRLNIGLELLREPLVLFVDEPTSGLSSRDSENIMDLLKELTLRGKLIFVVIHQPSSDIFKMFDRLLILDVGGYPIYYGNPVDAVVYFKEAANLIDRHEGSCPECGNVNPEQIFNIIENKVVDEYGRATNQRKITPVTWNKIYDERNKTDDAPGYVEKPDARLLIPGKIKQALIFISRDVKAKLNNRQYMLINFLEAPLLAFILATLVRYYTGDGLRYSAYVFQENMNIPAYVFMAIVVALFMGLTVSAEEIIKDRKILKREAFLNLSRGSYLMSKILMLLILSAVQTLTFVLVGNFILGIKGMYLAYWLVLFSASFFANVLGLNISSAFNSAVTIYIIIPILLIPQILLSGVVVQFDQLNPTFGAKARVPLIGDVMASRWAYEALLVTQYKDNDYEKHFFEVDKRISQAEFKSVYYVPQLESILEFVFTNRDDPSEETQKLMKIHREVLINEINILLQEVGKDKWPAFTEVVRSGLDSTLYEQGKTFLETLRKMYLHRQNEARQERESIVKELVNVPDGYDRYQALIRDYTNDQVTSLVLDNRELTRIMEYDGRLIQKIYPIYMDPDPKHFFDFSALFYLPEKHFAGYNIPTLYFNTAIIWVMSILLIILLYYDVLRRIINQGGA
jgi:ABC-type multidrug transport system ATPase subunit